MTFMKKVIEHNNTYRVEIEFDFKYTDQSKLEVCFLPNNFCSEDEKKMLSQCKTIEERNKLYDEMPWETISFHEGAAFGLNYAYNYYKENSSKVRGVRIDIYIKCYSGTTEEAVAFICAKELLDFLGFESEKIVYYLNEKYRFPYTKEFPPIGLHGIKTMIKILKGRTTNAELEKFLSYYINKQKEYLK